MKPKKSNNTETETIEFLINFEDIKNSRLVDVASETIITEYVFCFRFMNFSSSKIYYIFLNVKKNRI